MIGELTHHVLQLMLPLYQLDEDKRLLLRGEAPTYLFKYFGLQRNAGNDDASEVHVRHHLENYTYHHFVYACYWPLEAQWTNIKLHFELPRPLGGLGSRQVFSRLGIFFRRKHA